MAAETSGEHVWVPVGGAEAVDPASGRDFGG